MSSLLWASRMRSPFTKVYSRFYSNVKPQQPKKKLGMKELVKEYGWTATGVYLAFCCVDLPLSFLFVHSAGQDRLTNWELSVRDLVGANTEKDKTYVQRAASGGKSLLLAEFAVAYVIHKMCIFVRIPLTVALTPSIAAKLSKWGFKVKRAIPAVDKNKLASNLPSKTEAVNIKGTRNTSDVISKDAKNNR